MKLRVHAISVDHPEPYRDVYSVVVEKPDGERITCTFQAHRPRPEDDPRITAFGGTRETYLALLDYESPPPPPGQSGGALVIPALNRMVRLVMAYSRGEPIDLPVDVPTEPEPYPGAGEGSG